jgi:hypothetical protein
MHSLQESLASWATVLGTILSLIGLIQSRAWLTAISVVFVVASILTGVYARSKRLIVEGASVVVEGRSIDSLNIANLRRRVNRSLVIQEAHHVAEIEGEDLTITWKYSGYCRAAQETAMEFSIDTENNVPFNDLRCFAYDLRHDPRKEHKIRPVLVGADGISKKVAVPFLAPLAVEEPFSVLLKCELPGCMKAGLEYYISTLSFEQDLVRRCAVRLIFVGAQPSWVRVYDYTPPGRPQLLKDLRPVRQHAEVFEYVDIASDLEGQSARIYLFCRANLDMVAGQKR